MKNDCLFVFTLDKKRVHHPGILKEHLQQNDLDFPYSFTKGFRQIFWTVFNRILEKDFTSSFELLAHKITFEKLVVLESDKDTDIRRSEGTRYFIVLYGYTETAQPESLKSVFNIEMNKRELSEAEFAALIFSQIRQDLQIDPGEYYYHSRPELLGVNFYDISLTDAAKPLLSSIMYLTGLYHYGKVIFWRIIRNQVDIEISKFRNNKSTFEYIGQLKLQVLNLKRFFNMKNVSNNPIIKDYNRQLSEKFNLYDSYKNAHEIQQSISESIDHLDKLNNYNANKNIKLLLNITTFLAIPFSIISTLATLSLKSDVVVNAGSLLSNGNLIFVYMFGIMLPVFVFLVSMLLIRINGKLKS